MARLLNLNTPSEIPTTDNKYQGTFDTNNRFNEESKIFSKAAESSVKLDDNQSLEN